MKMEVRENSAALENHLSSSGKEHSACGLSNPAHQRGDSKGAVCMPVGWDEVELGGSDVQDFTSSGDNGMDAKYDIDTQSMSMELRRISQIMMKTFQ